MKAFLSHSSKDKAIVGQVADQLGLANVELDSETFDRGILNVTAIQDGLHNSSLFVLFLSKSALESGVVRYEAMLAQDLVARSLIERFLVVCLDADAFASAEANWKTFNFVRKAVSPQSIARLIQHNLILLRSRALGADQPFVGRTKELHSIKEKLIDPLFSRMRGIYVSGYTGIGRRTFAQRLFRDLYPSVISVFPEIVVEKLDGYEEIYRKTIEQVTSITTLSAWRTRVVAFAAENDNGKARLIAELLGRLIESREAIYIVDHGGLLDDQGTFQASIRNIIERVKPERRPYLVFVGDRMVPHARQQEIEGIVYCRLPPLTPDEAKQLVALKLRDADINYSSEELERLVDLCDGHPFNAAFLVEAVKHYGLALVLSDPSEIVQWKRRRASDFLARIDFTKEQQNILAALRLFNVLNLEILVSVSGSDATTVSAALAHLLDYHIVEADSNAFSISPPLWSAVDRDRRFEIRPLEQSRLLGVISQELTAKQDADEISASMIDAAILARLQEGDELPPLFAALLLPSHLVWLARRRYDEKRLEECIKLACSALDAMGRLSPAGAVEACRVLCLAAARRDQQEDFDRGISVLRASATDSWARSNLNYLLGFNARMRGRVPEAENFFRAAYDDSPGNFSAAHEIASICLARGNLTDAELFARQAFGSTPDNAYVLDILLRILMARDQQDATKNDQEISLLFDRLKLVGEEEGRSFYTTRRAEYELKFGSLDEACKLIDGAVAKTPGIFNVHALRAEIYLERGNKAIARDEISTMRGIVYRRNSTERLTNLRPFLEIESSYYAAIDDFEKAKAAYRKEGVFTAAEAADAIRRIEIEQSFKSPRK
jgi:tetratricopeptide (TPR) repeat protein